MFVAGRFLPKDSPFLMSASLGNGNHFPDSGRCRAALHEAVPDPERSYTDYLYMGVRIAQSPYQGALDFDHKFSEWLSAANRTPEPTSTLPLVLLSHVCTVGRAWSHPEKAPAK